MSAIAGSSFRRAVRMFSVVALVGATAIGCESSSSSDTTASPATTASTTTVTTVPPPAGSCAAGGDCAVGDTGPGGGVVIYLSAKNFDCGTILQSKCNAVEAAPAFWAKDTSGITGCTNLTEADPLCKFAEAGILYSETWRSLGGGLKSSLSLVAQHTEADGARAAMAYRGGGLSDWAAPSLAELNVLCSYARGGRTSREPDAMCYSGTPRTGLGMLSAKYQASSKFQTQKLGYADGVDLSAKSSTDDTPDPSSMMDRWAPQTMTRVRPVRTFLATVAAPATTTVKATTTTVKTTTATTVKATTTTVKVATTLAPTTTVALTCAQGGSCAVGDTGPGGGTVYYVSEAGFSCGLTLSSTCHYLEVSPTTWVAATALASANCTAVGSADVKCVWGNLTPTVDTSGAVGQGRKNTKAILDNAGVLTSVAAAVSTAYRGGGKDDWFLPSQHELDEMCKYANGKTTGDQSVRCSAGTLRSGFANGMYWASNDGGSSTAINIDFQMGQQNFPTKDLKFIVRPIRAF